MTRETTKRKRDKKRAEKRRHERLTEQMAEDAAKKKRYHSEEYVAIVVVLAFGFFMVVGVIWWPPGSSKGNIGLGDGTYAATYLGSRPASEGEGAVAVLQVGEVEVFVDESDLSGEAAEGSDDFFEGTRGEGLSITVEDGSIVYWSQE